MEYDLVMARGPSAAKTIKETILMINGMGRECTNGAIRVIIKGNFLMIWGMDLVKCIGMKIHIIKGSGGKVSSGDMGKYGRMMF